MDVPLSIPSVLKLVDLMESFGDLVKRLRTAKGFTQDTLGKAIGATQGYVAAIESGKKTNVGAPIMARLADALDADLSELTRAMVESAKKPAHLKVHRTASDRVLTPIVSVVPAGRPVKVEDIADEWIDLGDQFQEEGLVAYRVSGLSMLEEHIVDGDLVVVHPQEVADNGQVVVASINGELTLKKLFVDDAGRCWLRPRNRHMSIEAIELTEANDPRILGVYRGLTRRDGKGRRKPKRK